MASSFIAYVDESGDEGFKFRTPEKEGSTLWFSLSAVVVRRTNEPRVIRIIDEAREKLGKGGKFTLHFRNLQHHQRVMLAQRMERCGGLRISTVLAHKPSLVNSTLIASSRLYFFATRILLERISWLCRDAPNRYENGDGTCHVVFSNRSNLSYRELRDYLSMLLERSEELGCRINWTVIRPPEITASGPGMKGLQLADAAASSFYYSVEPDHFGNTEDRYVRLLLPRCYRHKGRLNRYGVKICCGNKQAETDIEASIPWLI